MHWTPSEADEAEEAAFQRRWGEWRALDPAEPWDVMSGYDREVLHHKARLARTKDRTDLEVAWPLLDAAAQDWLRDAVRRERADHPWLERMA